MLNKQFTMEVAITNFEKEQIHDEIKNKYCRENGIQFLRILYLDNRSVKDIIVEFITNHSGMGTVDAGVGVVVAV